MGLSEMSSVCVSTLEKGVCVCFMSICFIVTLSVCVSVCLPRCTTCQQEKQQMPTDHVMTDSCRTALMSLCAQMMESFRLTAHVEKLKQNVQTES